MLPSLSSRDYLLTPLRPTATGVIHSLPDFALAKGNFAKVAGKEGGTPRSKFLHARSSLSRWDTVYTCSLLLQEWANRRRRNSHSRFRGSRCSIGKMGRKLCFGRRRRRKWSDVVDARGKRKKRAATKAAEGTFTRSGAWVTPSRAG